MPPFYGSCKGCGKVGHSWKYCKTNPNALPFPGLRQVSEWEGNGNEEATAAVQQDATQTGAGLKQVTTDFGGKMSDDDLATHFHNLGWQVTPPGKKSNRMPGLKPLGYQGKLDKPPGLNPVTTQPQQNRWKKISMTVDSGAVDTVFPIGTVMGEMPTVATRSGFKYYGADGSEIPHRGEVKFQGETEKGSRFKMTAQVADITKPLCSVRRMTQAGNRVVFDDTGSYVENKQTGEITTINETRGDYHMEVWVDQQGDEAGDHSRLAAVGESSACSHGCAHSCPPPPAPHPVARRESPTRQTVSEDGLTTFIRLV